jgi:RND superfamily putative drug exporter
MFQSLGRFTTTYPKSICLAWLGLGLALTFLAPNWDTRTVDDDIRFLPERCPSVRGYRMLEQAFPQDVSASNAIFALERADRPLTAADFALADRCVDALERLRHEEPALQIVRVHSQRDPLVGKRLTSADGRCTLIRAALATPFLALQTQATVDRAEAIVRAEMQGPDLPRLLVTGAAGIGRDLTRASAESLDGTTWATIALVVIILLAVYRAPLLALVPLATIAVSVWVALNLLALLTLIPGVYLVNVSKVFAVVLLYGAGTDYCLFLISRYREGLADGMGPPDALRGSVATVGGALAASAATVVCGLGLMGFAEFTKVRAAGPAIGLSLIVALAASLTLTPALLRLAGTAAFWPVGMPRRSATPWRPDLWTRLSRLVVARPVLVWSVAVAALAPLAVLGLCVHPSFKPTSELAPTSDSIKGLAAIQRHFTAGETGPVTVLLASSADWDSAEGRRVLSHLTRGFGLLENVAEVRSLTQPLGQPLTRAAPPARTQANGMLDKLALAAPWAADLVRAQVERGARSFYLANVATADGAPRHVTRLDVVFRSDPFSSESRETLELIQTWLQEQLPLSAATLGGVQAECYGVTVNARDLASIVSSDQRRINLLVLGAILIILVVLVRRPGLAIYLLLTVLLSYYATLGATTLMGHLWNNRPLGELDWRVPFFLFTILVAVGEDYNILLMTRALQERKRHGAVEGIRRALARTGGTITSCGLIMAGTFGTLMLAKLGTLVQIGFALAFGVLLDTFVVRPFLVPAFTLLLWSQDEPAPRVLALRRRKWSKPRPLASQAGHPTY